MSRADFIKYFRREENFSVGDYVFKVNYFYFVDRLSLVYMLTFY